MALASTAVEQGPVASSWLLAAQPLDSTNFQGRATMSRSLSPGGAINLSLRDRLRAAMTPDPFGFRAHVRNTMGATRLIFSLNVPGSELLAPFILVAAGLHVVAELPGVRQARLVRRALWPRANER